MRFVPGIISAAAKLCLLGVNPEEGVTEAGMHVKAGGPETRVSVGGRRCRGSAATVASGKHEEVLSECEMQRASRSCCSECLANKQHEKPPLTEL